MYVEGQCPWAQTEQNRENILGDQYQAGRTHGDLAMEEIMAVRVEDNGEKETKRGLPLGTRCLTAEPFGPGRFGPLAFDVSCGWDLRSPAAEDEAAHEIEGQIPFLIVATPGHCELMTAVRLVRPLMARGACLVFGHFPIASPDLKALRAESPGLRKAGKRDGALWLTNPLRWRRFLPGRHAL